MPLHRSQNNQPFSLRPRLSCSKLGSRISPIDGRSGSRSTASNCPFGDVTRDCSVTVESCLRVDWHAARIREKGCRWLAVPIFNYG